MRKIISALLLSFSLISWGQSHKTAINFSVWDPLATLPVSYHQPAVLSLGIPESKTSSLSGLSVNFLNTVNYGVMNGVQITGIYSRIDSIARGFTFTGIYNIQRNNFSGVAASGLMSINKGMFQGLQVSNVQNIEITDLEGLQIAGFMNVVGGTLHGGQMTAGINVAQSIQSSIQIAGLVNFSLHDSKGIQIGGLVNVATSLKGAQIGLLNFTKKLQGVQIGAINYSADTNAVKIGLVSVSPRTQIRPIVFWSNISTYNAGVRFMNRYTYSIIGFGTPYDPIHFASSGLIFYRLGVYHTVRRLTLSGDLGISYLLFFSTSHGDSGISGEGRINVEYALNQWLSIIASGGYTKRKYFFGSRTTQMKPIAEVGIILPNILNYRSLK
ncbi:LA_2272 family surface repeat-containing protein [Microbacter margulisiae]|uniref:DUF5723 domain-containing protein n=1 Tax=Microbacter margulisiae TaxID=1350067 RepID=A0A7W5DQU3_9PORP|nr:hypothetical protein [Microbacter margulisiae]MBB3187331.1 hypothetical protein [Microbacter margulisiae]